ncbi:hypothetical protein B0G75_106104 [Paraburkholderia sp. BL18I3N2]|nr:hypothetical protein B0G75_106104 [Paraburkholderia sp. BL18I3N2]
MLPPGTSHPTAVPAGGGSQTIPVVSQSILSQLVFHKTNWPNSEGLLVPFSLTNVQADGVFQGVPTITMAIGYKRVVSAQIYPLQD